MNNEQPKNIERERDAEDQLVDWGLKANSGAEAAPDLSDKILAAIDADGAAEPTSKVTRTESSNSSKVYWGIGIAATLLLMVFAVSQFLPPHFKLRVASMVNPQLEPENSMGGANADASGSWWGGNESKVAMETPKVIIQDEEESAQIGDDDFGLVSDQSGVVTASSGPTATSSKTEPGVSITGGGRIGERGGRPGLQQRPFANSFTTLDPAGPHRYAEEYKRGQFDEASGELSNAAPFAFFIPDNGSPQTIRFGTLGDFDLQGKHVELRYEPVTTTQTQVYTVSVPQQRTRTVNYTVMVPEERTRTVENKTETYTINVPQTRVREESYTVVVPEQRTRHVPVVNHVPKLLDKNGNEIVLNDAQRKEFEVLIQQQGLGKSPEVAGDQYERIYENPFVVAKGTDAVSTFSIDVDTASYSNVRQYLNNGQLPPPDAVRLEELVNYFDYDYAGPDGEEHPFATHTEVVGCPWNSQHRLVRVAIKGREIAREKRPLSNVVFLVDVSGSMNEPNKLPLVVEGLSYMAQELGENDRVSIVVYAGSEGLALPATRGDQHDKILAALENLRAGGSTAGGAGIKLAYKIAEENFIKGGTNRVLLCTDGDFNVGLTSTADLERLAEQKAKDTGVFLTVLGYGRGNLNDAMMETISNRGNGNYHYIDNLREARRVLVQQLSGTLVTIAKDVKIQVEFNPANVAGYRLLGYENRMLQRKDFDDDTKDAGEVGAGHTVTALYEIAPTGVGIEDTNEEDDELKYQQTASKPVEEVANADEKFTDELLTLRLRYKQPTESTSTKIEVAVKDEDLEFKNASEDFRFASSVAGFGMLLRGSQHKGDATYSMVKDVASKSLGDDDRGYRAEFLNLIKIAGELSSQ